MKSGFFYINGVSLTKFIDIKKQNVSYQNENSTYQDIVDKAIQEYNFPGMTYIWTEQSRSKKVGRFLLQFQETDWEFIKRVASIENLGLIPNMTGKQTQFFIGLPKGREEKIVPYCKHKVHRLLEKAEKEVVNNKVNTIWQGDYIQYELYDITEHYELGDVVRFQDMQYIVIEKISTLFKKDGILRNNYVIQQKKGIAFPRLYNNALRGNSLTGTVIDVKRNFTKLHLHIDEEQQDIATAFWFPQPQCFTAGSDSGFCIMPERGDTMRLHFPTKDETEHYIICSDNGDFSKLLSSLNASKGGKEPEKATKVSGSNAPYEKFLTTPGQKGMLLNDGMIKYHTTGDISTIQMEDGKGISISSDGNIELLANNINLKAGAKLNITAGKKIEISCIGSSMIIDGEGDRIDKKAPDIFFDSPENVIVDVPVDAIEQLFASQAAERKAAVLEFTPDEIRITAENKFDDGIYQLLYDVWKKTSGEYDPKDDKPIVDPRGNTTTKNETKFKYWAMEQYGMTAEEYRGYTFKGTGKTILETAGAYFKVTAPIDAKKGITYLAKKGVTPKNILKAAFGMTDNVAAKEMKYISENAKGVTENVVNSSLRELMSPEEVARYDKYWLDVAEKTSNDFLKKHIIYINKGKIKKPTGGKFKPAKVSAAVDLNTGNIYIGYNGSNPKIFNPSRTEIVHELQQRIEYTKNLAANTIDNEYASRMSFQMWSVDNCAEIYAVNNLLKDGGDINNIFINTKYSIEKQIDTYLKTALPCKNCQITFEGCFFAKK